MDVSQKPDGLSFDYTIYDGVKLRDGRLAIITGYGIYDNQYWCEVCYPDGVHLESADYFSSDSQIVTKLSTEQRNRVANALLSAIYDNQMRWPNVDWYMVDNSRNPEFIRNAVFS